VPDSRAEGAAVVTCGSFHAVLRPGEQLQFGRSAGNQLRIGHAPEDRRVPRTAGRFECREDGVLIHNLSDKRILLVSTFPGPGYEIAPLMIGGTHPHGRVRVSLSGHAAKYVIHLDARGLDAARDRQTGTETADDDATVGFRRIEKMSARHRLFLTALCLPLMTSSGRTSQIPSYAGIETLFAEFGYTYKAKTIRNNLDELRQWLTNEHDIEDLLAPDDEPAGSSRVVDKLAHWAIRSGNVTDADVERLERHAPGEATPG
jgi:hypothetical protein